MGIAMKLKVNPNNDGGQKAENIALMNSENPSGVETKNDIEKEEISNMVRNGEKENGGIPNNWGKHDRRIFNAKLWNCADKILETTQENPIIKRNPAII